MFNFNLMNRALKDAELKDAFRMLYYIVNKCSLKNSMSVEIFDAEFELALSISPRSTCRFTKKLEERGYIKKEVRGTSQNKLANTYTLIDVEVNNTPTDSICNEGNKSDAQKFPLTDDANIDGSSDGRIGILKNNNKINKKNNIFLSNNINIPDTDIDNTDDKNVPLTDDANIDGSSDGSSDGRIGILKNNIKINKKNIHVNIHDNINTGDNIPEVINKNKFIEHDVNNINIDNSDEIFLSNFMKVDNINTGNSDVEIKDLRIEENINLNNESEMNEERVNEMNNINKSNETYMNNSTLEEILETQALDDNQAFNTFSSFKNKETNNSKPKQDRYQRLFEKCKSQIEIWSKTHEYSCISMFDAFFKAIQDMNDQHLISVKQWDAAQRYLFQRFKNLRIGYNNYIQNKNKTISSNEVNELNIPRPPRQNDQMEEVV